jgi:hypothetical protein
MDCASERRLALASMAVRYAAPRARLHFPWCPKTLHARFASSCSMAAEGTNARPEAQNQHAAFLKALFCAIACGWRG